MAMLALGLGLSRIGLASQDGGIVIGAAELRPLGRGWSC